MNLAEAANGPEFDLVVIGGGINGCAIAAEGARRGLRTALFEASDFGFGTTWRSTKLIHGGLRYLEHRDFGLVFESLRERAWLLRAKPHLVRPQRFVLPVLPWTRRPAWQLRAGLAMYDGLAFRGGVPAHRHIGAAGAREEMPFLTEEVRDGFAFYDARARSPERLTLELALLAERRGALIANHASVTRIGTASDSVSSVTVEHGGATYELRANAVVNAAGPWVESVRALAPGDHEPLLGVTRGTHIAVELEGPMPADAVFSFAKGDGRVFFAVPQDDLLLVGTTDVRFDDDPSSVSPTREDVEYLLEEAVALLPGLDITIERIRYAYAGLRPLQRDPGGPEAAISRRHSVIDHGKNGGPSGLYSVVGGKLSTFRPLARDVMELVGAPRWVNRERPRPAPREMDETWKSATPRLSNYGPVLPAVIAAGQGVLCSVCGILEGEVRHAVAVEHATTIGDVVLRRAGTGWTPSRGLCCHEAVAGVMGDALGWTVDETSRQREAFRREVRQHLPLPGDILESE